jgi:hypothetical protein
MPAPTLSDLETKYFSPGPFLGTPHSADTVVAPNVDGEAFFRAIADVLDTCKGPGDRIYIASWQFDQGIVLKPGSKSLGTILVDKAAAGADVRVIVAAGRFATGIQGFSPADELRSSKHGTATPLESRVLLDWGGYNDSRHEKSTVIYSAATDKLHAFVGGIDYEPRRIADEMHTNGWWHDAGVQLEEGAAAAVLGNFRTRWIETTTLPPLRYMLDGIIEPYNPLITLA